MHHTSLSKVTEKPNLPLKWPLSQFARIFAEVAGIELLSLGIQAGILFVSIKAKNWSLLNANDCTG